VRAWIETFSDTKCSKENPSRRPCAGVDETSPSRHRCSVRRRRRVCGRGLKHLFAWRDHSGLAVARRVRAWIGNFASSPGVIRNAVARRCGRGLKRQAPRG